MDWLSLALTWILFCGAIVALAAKRGRSRLGWFAIAVITSPLVAAVWILCLEDLAASRRHRELLQAVSRAGGPRQPIRGPKNWRPTRGPLRPR